MALFTDIIDPAELTGYVRAALEDQEVAKGTLGRYLPNATVADQVIRMFVGQSGLVPEARYRAFDAEPEIGKAPGGKRVTLDLPALSQAIPVSEYMQLRARGASDAQLRDVVKNTALRTAQAIADRTERQRGQVLATGRAVINQDNYAVDTAFGRDGDLTTQAPKSWTDTSVDRIGYLESLVDLYVQRNGVEPGVMLTSRRVMRALAQGDQLATTLVGGATRPATESDARATLAGAGLPDIEIFSRRTASGPVLPDDTILFLPAPVDPNGGASELGGTFWGQTLTAMDPTYGIEIPDQPGIVTGTYRNPKPPMIVECISDALVMPALANANLSLAAKVLF